MHYESMRAHMNPWEKNIVKVAFNSNTLPEKSRLLFLSANNAKYVELALTLGKKLKCMVEVSEVEKGYTRPEKTYAPTCKSLEKKGATFIIDRIKQRHYHAAFMVYVLEGICPEENRLCLLTQTYDSLVDGGKLWIEIRGPDWIKPGLAAKVSERCHKGPGVRTAQATFVTLLEKEDVASLLSRAGFPSSKCLMDTTRHLQFVATR